MDDFSLNMNHGQMRAIRPDRITPKIFFFQSNWYHNVRMRFWSVFMHLTRIKNAFDVISDMNGDNWILVQSVRIPRKKISLGNSVAVFLEIRKRQVWKNFSQFLPNLFCDSTIVFSIWISLVLHKILTFHPTHSLLINFERFVPNLSEFPERG